MTCGAWLTPGEVERHSEFPNWVLQIYENETYWLDYNLDGPTADLFVIEVPFVEGFFVGRLLESGQTWIDHGPFPTLSSAILSIALIS